MCKGPRKPSPPPSPPTGPVVVDGDSKKPAVTSSSLLLELSASDDLAAFKLAVEVEAHPVDASAAWYSRSIGPASAPARRMGFEQRTPLMIAALYGSTAVLRYILSASWTVDVNRRCGLDGATALHCAASGGSLSSAEVVKLLIDAGADVDALDFNNNRPGDVIAKQFSGSTARSLEVVLRASCPRVSSPSKEEDTKPGEKKEYPLDLTLPDIKNGIYGTDEFRMYTFKVKPCSRAYSHDWTECPFVHPGENARRRDPRKYLYSCVPCPEFRKGSCRNGDSCEYAHGVFECWLHPAQYRTRLCKDEIGCNRRVCFFAHKPEELRSVNPTTASFSGMVLPSPRSSPLGGLSSLDMATALMMMQPGSPSPLSPSASSGMGSPSVWMNQAGGVAAPTLQLPSSRLKSTMSARDFDLDLNLMGLEGYQQKLIDEISSTATPRSNWTANALAAASAAASSRASEYSELFGSLDPSILSQLQGLSLNQTGNQFQSPSGINQQLFSGYGSNLPSSPTLNASSSLGLDHSMAKAIMNSRSAAFANRSQSFCDRGAVRRLPTGLAATPTSSLGMSDWGSPDGKLDWCIQGEELNKFRKSASFGIRNNQGGFGGLGSPEKVSDEPDLSWVQTLVKDGPAAVAAPPQVTRFSLDPQQQQKYELNGGAEMFTPWGEQLFAEQEQMVA